VLITHRLEGLEQVDEVLVLDGGRVAEPRNARGIG
jgi:ABC-type transport system involved in cytochrome bd biosynthesis fused ATPase/permease subunit